MITKRVFANIEAGFNIIANYVFADSLLIQGTSRIERAWENLTFYSNPT